MSEVQTIAPALTMGLCGLSVGREKQVNQMYLCTQFK